MKRMTLLVLASAAAAASAAPKADIARGKEIATTVCAACHAADGNSGVVMYPKLAGQHPAYTIKETLAIKNHKRLTGGAASMAPMVAGLSDQDIADVAAYYSKQYPKPGEANPKQNFELGAKIFRGGLADKKIPACMACHSPNGAGMPAGGTEVAAYPRLSGQHQSYIVEQLKAYASGQRKSGMMGDIAKRMTEEEMNAVGNFIQGLH
ncbi:c-type cytochrome [Neisseria leonii]|uniref:C-type cytochrome n=1 Tax=Neisseria leonii TaxID=2995413 RepID=A0A9X4E2W9_9NEIS|nr:c-type cytochrome [Neisseria sp. 51.81]MDD9328627.1 cytochrome c4 [Neisseria sp. 51.81]